MLSKYFLWGQDKNSKNYLVPMISKFSDGDMIPIDIFFEWGQGRTFENYLVPIISKYF